MSVPSKQASAPSIAKKAYKSTMQHPQYIHNKFSMNFAPQLLPARWTSSLRHVLPNAKSSRFVPVFSFCAQCQNVCIHFGLQSVAHACGSLIAFCFGQCRTSNKINPKPYTLCKHACSFPDHVGGSTCGLSTQHLHIIVYSSPFRCLITKLYIHIVIHGRALPTAETDI